MWRPESLCWSNARREEVGRVLLDQSDQLIQVTRCRLNKILPLKRLVFYFYANNLVILTTNRRQAPSNDSTYRYQWFWPYWPKCPARTLYPRLPPGFADRRHQRSRRQLDQCPPA